MKSNKSKMWSSLKERKKQVSMCMLFCMLQQFLDDWRGQDILTFASTTTCNALVTAVLQFTGRPRNVLPPNNVLAICVIKKGTRYVHTQTRRTFTSPSLKCRTTYSTLYSSISLCEHNTVMLKRHGNVRVIKKEQVLLELLLSVKGWKHDCCLLLKPL